MLHARSVGEENLQAAPTRAPPQEHASCLRYVAAGAADRQRHWWMGTCTHDGSTATPRDGWCYTESGIGTSQYPNRTHITVIGLPWQQTSQVCYAIRASDRCKPLQQQGLRQAYHMTCCAPMHPCCGCAQHGREVRQGAGAGGRGAAPGVHDAEHGVVQHEARDRLECHQEIHPSAVGVGRQLATIPCSSHGNSPQKLLAACQRRIGAELRAAA